MSNQEDELWSHIDRMIYLNKDQIVQLSFVSLIIKVGTVSSADILRQLRKMPQTRLYCQDYSQR